jgi:hypothetical protein
LSPVTDFREACCRQYEMGLVSQLYDDMLILLWYTLFCMCVCVCETFAAIVHLVQVC